MPTWRWWRCGAGPGSPAPAALPLREPLRRLRAALDRRDPAGSAGAGRPSMDRDRAARARCERRPDGEERPVERPHHRADGGARSRLRHGRSTADQSVLEAAIRELERRSFASARTCARGSDASRRAECADARKQKFEEARALYSEHCRRMLENLPVHELRQETSRDDKRCVRHLASFLGRSPDTATPEGASAVFRSTRPRAEPSYPRRREQMVHTRTSH